MKKPSEKYKIPVIGRIYCHTLNEIAPGIFQKCPTLSYYDVIDPHLSCSVLLFPPPPFFP